MASGTDVELATDHTTRVPRTLRHPRDAVRYTNAGIVYCYGDCRFGSVDGLVALFKWVHVIDDTVTPADVLCLRVYQLDPVDEMRFYAELNEMGLSHLE
jgi:hypothetical protein